MPRAKKTSLNCTGAELPDIPIVKLSPVPESLDDFCQVLQPEDEVLLHEYLSEPQKHYWVIIQADDYPMAVCELEAYADYMQTQNQWTGRRSDYLLIGSSHGKCCLIVVELRHVLVKAQQEEDKLAQLREAIKQLIQNHLAIVDQTDCLAKVYDKPEAYTIVGVIIAPGATRNFNRRELNRREEIESHPVLLVTLPSNALSDCRITWTRLMEKIGFLPKG
ncbi:MAG: hypothetical protein AAGD25_20990 [Cyanobacteria bacterium P01_F01_bin.150]